MGPPSPEPLPVWRDYQRLFETLADPVFVLKVGEPERIRIVAANTASEAFFGVPASACIDRLLPDLLPAPAARQFIAECGRCSTANRPVEFRLELVGDVRRSFGVKLNKISHDNATSCICAVARVLRADSILESGQSTEHFKVIAEYAADFISRCDVEGRILYLNPAIERLMGTSSASLAGRDVSEWAAGFPHIDTYLECVHRVAETGELQTAEMTLPDASSGQAVSHQIRYAPEWGPEGNVLSVIGIGRDITPLKAAEAELIKLNATLEERVAARTLDLERANSDLRSFAWTVSHDLRAPLRAIRGFLYLLAEDEGSRLTDDGRAMLGRVVSSATRLDGLINAILAYSQTGQNALSGQRVEMERIAREVAAELNQQPSRVHIEIARLPVASADITMARQIYQNLINNALKFSAGREHPTIEVGWLEQHDEAVYYVRDNGVGFDMQYAGKLYSMFERLHAQDEFPGNGVGLAIVKRLVERHGGRIWAESRAEQGATFYFTLSAKPRASSDAATT
jgi:PAS domain S-box-containing protein